MVSVTISLALVFSPLPRSFCLGRDRVLVVLCLGACLTFDIYPAAKHSFLAKNQQPAIPDVSQEWCLKVVMICIRNEYVERVMHILLANGQYWLVLLFFIYFILMSFLKFANFSLGYIGSAFVVV